MTEAGDSRRRLIMMMTIILAGTAVTFIDLSPVAVIFIALGIGLVMLFALNMISFEELKDTISSLKTKLNQPVNLKTEKSKKSPENDENTAGAKSNKNELKKELPFAPLFRKLPFVNRNSKEKKQTDKEVKSSKKSVFSGIFGLLSKKKEAETKNKQIDELLDKTLSGESPPIEIPAGDEDNEFGDFDNFDLGLEENNTTEIPEDQNIKGFEDEIPDSTIADILAKEGIELELDDEEFPTGSSDEEETESQKISDSGIGDIDELDDDVSGFDLDDNEFGDFDDIDLDELEPEDEIDLGDEDAIEDVEIGNSEEESAEPEVALLEEDDILSAPPKEWTQTKTAGMAESEENMFENPTSLSLGGETDDEDLFDMLKSDTKKVVSVQETSLVRDLLDAKINTEELVEDLEGVLEQFGVEKEQIKGKNKISDEGDINDQSLY